MLTQNPCLPNFPQDSEFAPRVTEEWAVTQGIKEKQNRDESKTKSRLCNRTPVSFRVLEVVAVYLLQQCPSALTEPRVKC